MKKLGFRAISVVVMTLLLSGCVNLKVLNNYSVSSSAAIREFEFLHYNFTQHCMDRCLLEAIASFEVKRDLDCKCDLYHQADSVTQLLYNALNCYFEGLARISNDELTYYNFDALKKSLAEGEFGRVSISKEQAGAYLNVSRILLNATAGAYRKDKIKDFIRQSNEPVQILLSKLQFILVSNLKGEIKFKKERLYGYYNDLKRSTNLSDYEKVRAVNDYYEQLSDLNNEQKQIDLYASGLKSIAEGHQLLFNSLDKFNSDQTKTMLTRYTSDIHETFSAFNKQRK
jgi:hypothetical protein